MIWYLACFLSGVLVGVILMGMLADGKLHEEFTKGRQYERKLHEDKSEKIIQKER